MIHGGLNLDLRYHQPMAQHCCLRQNLSPIDPSTNFWHDKNFIPLRDKNKSEEWDPGCNNCRLLEQSGYISFRQGMNQGLALQDRTELSGPARIDLMFDISCNLACRTCGDYSSTFWQKHLKDNGFETQAIASSVSSDRVIQIFQQLDLTNLRQVVFCGGETLLGQAHWEVADWLAHNVPNAKQQLTLCFQTNGTQPINIRNHDTINKFFLVKLHVSLDGIGSRFEYLRWPASWSQVTDNIMTMKETLPSNVMFLIEETISIFNLAYLDELDTWAKQNFVTNKEGDPVNHTRHMAKGIFSLDHCSQEYIDWCVQKRKHSLIPTHWSESAPNIKAMLTQISKFDHTRNQSFARVFPEVAAFYHRFM
jgi:sulfatase maturation enzyme AslB (radical SAM superfamily)